MLHYVHYNKKWLEEHVLLTILVICLRILITSILDLHELLSKLDFGGLTRNVHTQRDNL